MADSPMAKLAAVERDRLHEGLLRQQHALRRVPVLQVLPQVEEPAVATPHQQPPHLGDEAVGQRRVRDARRLQAAVLQRRRVLGGGRVVVQQRGACTDEGLLSLCLPHSRLYGESP